MEKERDWVDEERLLNMVYIRRGYSQIVAKGMAQREITKRMVEYGYPVKGEEGGEKAKPKLVTSQKKGAKK